MPSTIRHPRLLPPNVPDSVEQLQPLISAVSRYQIELCAIKCPSFLWMVKVYLHSDGDNTSKPGEDGPHFRQTRGEGITWLQSTGGRVSSP